MAPMTRPSLVQQATDVRKAYECLEVPLPVGSRFAQMIDALDEGGWIPETDPQFPAAREALRDLQLLWSALKHLRPVVGDAETARWLRKINRDILEPHKGTDRSPGRDAQFEFYVAAICTKAGMAISFQEPDLLCDLQGERYALAVKRVKSQRKFEKNFRSAVRQIERSRATGFAVMDLSVFSNPENRSVRPPSTAQRRGLEYRAKWKPFVDGWFPRMKQIIGGREVRGLIIHDLNISAPDYVLETFSYGVPLSPDNRRRKQEFDRFYESYKRGTGRD